MGKKNMKLYMKGEKNAISTGKYIKSIQCIAGAMRDSCK